MRRSLALVAFVVGSVSLLAGADEGPTSAASALRAAQAPLRDRDWAKAAGQLAAVRAAHPAAPEAEEAWVLEAGARLRAGDARGALDAAVAFGRERPASPWAGRMLGTLADAYAALKAPAEEAAVLRTRAEALTGETSRAKVAALYVALGDPDFDGRPGIDDLGRPTVKKDVAAALDAYDRALAVGVAAEDVLRVRTRRALALEALGRPADAFGAWDALVKEDPKGPGADPEAWLVGRARTRLAAGARAEARADLRDAQRRFPRGTRALEVLVLLGQERFAAAAVGSPADHALAFDEGVGFFRQAVVEHRDAPAAVEVQRELADRLGDAGQPEKAAAEWRGLLERVPGHGDAPLWRDELATALVAAGRHDDAVREWQGFLAAYPNHPRWAEVQARIPQAKFAKGAMFAAQQEPDAAIAAWRAFADEFPAHASAPDALLRAGALAREQRDFEGAIATWRGVTGRYAGSPQAPTAWLAIAMVLEDDLGRLDDAVTEYEALLQAHGGAVEARARLARLKGKHLEVRGERVIGPTEAAVLRVVTRNVPELTVRVYKLGLEEYFRRTQGIGGLEALPVEIVKPDATAAWKAEPYVPFALTSLERPVPTAGPGAYVVVVGDADLTSTTLLLVSDLETVVKAANGRQVFVWARSRASGAPVEGARVLVSDGTTVFLEGTTGKDGVYVADVDRPATAVLVTKDGMAAATSWAPGPTFAEGFSSKAHVSTDRPVYRPGQTVAFRAIYRRASGGAYEIPAGVKGQALLVDPRGAEVERKDVVAGELGTFAGAFVLDGEAALGDWTVRLAVDEKQFDGRFRVLEFRKPEFTVAVTPGRPSYRTGEEGAATVRLAYTFGGPVVGAPVRWQVVRVPRDFTPSAVDDYAWYFQDPDALARARAAARTAPQGALVARGEATTDAKGEATVTFATQERDEDAEYVVTASAIDVTRRFVTDEGRIPVVRRDHAAVVRTDKRVYRPQQELRATFTTVDANQTPVGKAGDAVLVRLRRTVVPAGKGRPERLAEEEVEVSNQPANTDAKGRVEVRVPAPAPGAYRMRWRSLDGRGAVVTAYAAFDVAGAAEDLTKDVRLVAAKETYVEGERAEVLLRSPVTATRALLTFEGEKVLGYRLVDVDGPSTVLDLPIEAAYAPNVVLKVAVPSKAGLLEAEDEIVVFRYLQVKVTPSTTTAKPGDEVRFDVTTTDAAGAPVPAEVGVAVVDEALFAVAPELAPAIRPFFYDRKRVNRVVTSSSVGFRTYGATRATDPNLLADAAARHGDPNVAAAASLLRQARAALERGRVEAALASATTAAGLDPSSWDARNLVSELQARPEIQSRTKERLSVALAENADLRQRTSSLESQYAEAQADFARKQQALARAQTQAAGAEDAQADGRVAGLRAEVASAEQRQKAMYEKLNDLLAPATPSTQLACGAGKCGSGGVSAGDVPTQDGHADAVVLDLDDVTNGLAADPAGPSKSKSLGGRPRHGGPGLPGGTAPNPSAGAYFNDGADGDFRGRAESVYKRPQGAVSGGLYRADFDVEKALDAAGGGASPVLRKAFADTAAFEPRVVTDAAGRASLSVKLPDNLTTWRATARGIAGASLVGEARATVVARRDLLLRVDAPRFLVQGDHVTVPSVVHNAGTDAVTATVRMKATGAALDGTDGDVVVPASGRGLADRVVRATAPGAVRLEAEAVAGGASDRVEVAFGTLPRGVRAVDGRSGVVTTRAGDVTETFLEVPAGAVAGATRLTVALWPGLDASILDALAFLDGYPYGCVEQTVHRVLPAAWARRALLATGSPDAKALAGLEQGLTVAVGRLRNLANEDGAFGWWRGGRSDVAMTALALLGYAAARDAGVASAQPELDRTAAALLGIVRSGSDDVQALAHWALAAVGRADEEAYQVTFRRRNEELSTAGVAWLAMAAVARGRAYDVDELARRLEARRIDEPDGTTRWAPRADDCFVGSPGTATALAVRALVVCGVASDAAERGMAWLLAHRPTDGVGTTMEAAAFVGACAAWAERARPSRFGGTIRVLVDGVEARAVAVKPGQALAASDRRFALDVAGWGPGRHTLAFRLEGEGEVRWAARLESTVASEALEALEHGVAVERLYLDAALPRVEGTELPPKPGYEVLRPAARPKVEARSRATAVSGERVLVRLVVTAPRDLRFVVVEDPLPAGFEVLDETAAGPFDAQERRDDRQVFFLSDVKAGAVALTYVLQAVHPGRFTALPARASALYLPEVHGRSAGHVFDVSAGPTGGGGEATPTPDERFAAMQRALAARGWADALAAARELTPLPLRDDVAEAVESVRLRCALEQQDRAEIVRAREELVRRAPGRIPTDLASARTIAAAYADTGAPGVAATLFRDLLAGAFATEAGWAETLRGRGRELDGLAALETALRAAPASNAVASAALARALRLKDLPRPAGGTLPAGAPMDAESVAALRDVAAHFADLSFADPASYALIEGLRRVRDVDGAIAEAEAFPRRFPTSTFVDQALYFLLDAKFQRFDAAPSKEAAVPVLAAAQQLVEWRLARPDGTTVPSPLRPRAWHVRGRVLHVLGDLPGAIDAYRRAPEVEDAREALAWLTATGLELPERVVASIGGTASLPLRYRNVGDVTLRVYPVDLQVLFAMRRTLVGLHQVNLAGLTAAQTWTIGPKDGGDHGWHDAVVDLPAGKDAAGAFLVVAKSGDREASTLVLKTDLRAAVQPVGEGVRVHVTDAAGRGVRGAFVTVSDGTAVQGRGVTDARGVLEVRGVGTTPFVVVNVGDRTAVAP